MPYNLTRSISLIDSEILKYSMGDEPKKSGVLDSVFFTGPTVNARAVVPKGTILTLSVTSPGKQLVAYSGTGNIVGVLARNVEILASSTAGEEAVSYYFHNAIFATMAIVNFTNYASALVSSLPTCKFE